MLSSSFVEPASRGTGDFGTKSTKPKTFNSPKERFTYTEASAKLKTERHLIPS
jgi:hemolysin activation/secretion protein